MDIKYYLTISSFLLFCFTISSCNNDREEVLRKETNVLALVMEGPSEPPCDYFINYGEPYFPSNLPDSMKIHMQDVKISFEYTGEEKECIYVNGNNSEIEQLPIINILSIEKL